MQYDIAIIGAGPAGTLTAALLKKDLPHLNILLLDKASFPRHHVGEVTLPGWSKILKRAGVYELLDQHTPIKKAGVVFNWGPKEAGHVWTADFRENENGRPADGSWHVQRDVFDHLLVKHVRSLGCTVLEMATLQKISPKEHQRFVVQFEHNHSTHHIQSRYLIDASGQARVLQRMWKLPCTYHEQLNNFALYGYWKNSKILELDWKVRGTERWTLISSVEHGWVWHIPIDEQITSVGLVTNKETLQQSLQSGWSSMELYQHAARGTAQLDGLLENAEYIGHLPANGDPNRLQSVQDWSYASQQFCGDGWFLVGDAAMFVDPILSSGLTLVSHGAVLVANAILTLEHPQNHHSFSPNHTLLQESYTQAYQDLAQSYLRMAEVWYQRNLRGDSWHWQAKHERLRAGGLSILESDQDAFTAVCLGAIGSPLDAVLSKNANSQWGTEFFSWLTSNRLFATENLYSQHHLDANVERIRTRQILHQKWRQLLLQPSHKPLCTWQIKRRYHTNAFTTQWHLIDYLELRPNDPKIPSMVFPSFEEIPDGILAFLNGENSIFQCVQKCLASLPYPTYHVEYQKRQLSIIEMLIQLQMMGLLNEPSNETKPLNPPKDHPVIAILLQSFLKGLNQGLPQPLRFSLEIDWMGDGCHFQILLENHQSFWLHLYQSANTIQHNIPNDSIFITKIQHFQKILTHKLNMQKWQEIESFASFGMWVTYESATKIQIETF